MLLNMLPFFTSSIVFVTYYQPNRQQCQRGRTLPPRPRTFCHPVRLPHAILLLPQCGDARSSMRVVDCTAALYATTLLGMRSIARSRAKRLDYDGGAYACGARA